METALREALVRAAEQFGTPVYVYDKAVIEARCRALSECIPFARKKLLYAMKANSNQAVVRTILNAGFGVDCVSLGEVLFAKKLGAQTILYTNNNVADAEFQAVVALTKVTPGLWINCDSLQRVGDLPEGSALFARINGPVGGGHHHHVITAGP